MTGKTSRRKGGTCDGFLDDFGELLRRKVGANLHRFEASKQALNVFFDRLQPPDADQEVVYVAAKNAPRVRPIGSGGEIGRRRRTAAVRPTSRNLASRIEQPPKLAISDHAPASSNGWSERSRPRRTTELISTAC